MLDFTERRKFPRVNAHLPIKYKELNEEEQSAKGGLTKNLSLGGVKFYTDRFISLACRMVVEVNIPTKDEPVRAISKVAWIRKLAAGDDYEIGNQFLDMTRKDRTVLENYVRNAANLTSDNSIQ